MSYVGYLFFLGVSDARLPVKPPHGLLVMITEALQNDDITEGRLFEGATYDDLRHPGFNEALEPQWFARLRTAEPSWEHRLRGWSNLLYRPPLLPTTLCDLKSTLLSIQERLRWIGDETESLEKMEERYEERIKVSKAILRRWHAGWEGIAVGNIQSS